MTDAGLVHDSALDAAGAADILRGQEVGALSVPRLLGQLRPDTMRGLDLAFVPHWYCRFRVELEGGRSGWGGARAHQVADAVWVMVEGLTGKPLRLADEPPLLAQDLAMLAPAVVLPPRLGREQAVARATEDLRWDLRIRGRQRFAPRALELVDAHLAHVPFWIGYYQGPGGQLRARALHGIERSVQDAAFTQQLLRALDQAI